MRRRTQARFVSCLVVAVALMGAGTARADTQFLAPDVLLLIDSSGSMERTTLWNGTDWAMPQCGTWVAPKSVDMNATVLEDAGHTYTASDRWMMVVKALTGSVQDMACVTQLRTDPRFRDEFGIGDLPASSVQPIDTGYYLPYNRIVARANGKACTPAPSWKPSVRTALDANALSWPTSDGGPIIWREIGDFDVNNTTACSFTPQDTDGAIDQWRQQIRFGLMTFDTIPHYTVGNVQHIGIGIVSGSHVADWQPGVLDTWSFFENWLSDTSFLQAVVGNPGGCSDVGNLIEVGARNPAAPPWEGRLITFGKTGATTDEVIAHNEQVQQALIALRPFGATPLAGMLDDARHFLLNDNSNFDPYIGGAVDSNAVHTVGQGCRKRFAVLLTDGEPNLDLRPDCEALINGVQGHCPYPLPVDSAKTLQDNNVPLFVIGFTINAGQKCSDLLVAADACDAAKLPPCTTTCPYKCAYGYCVNGAADQQRAACCNIRSVANAGAKKANGDPQDPYWAEDTGSLEAAIQTIFNDIGTKMSTRTIPVFASGNANAGQTAEFPGARFSSSYIAQPGDLSAGSLLRSRYECKPPPTKLNDPVAAGKGDDFKTTTEGINGSYRDKRMIYSVLTAAASDGVVYGDRSVRPYFADKTATDDHLGGYNVSTSTANNMVSGLAPTFVTNVSPEAMLGSATCPAGGCCPKATLTSPAPDADTCRSRMLKMELGLPQTETGVTFVRASALGAIMHSTPVIMGPPNELLRDEAYTAYSRQFASRAKVMYAATTDGQLHAWKINNLDDTQAELWAFMPPAVLASLKNQFPDRFHPAEQILLDGPVAVRNMAGTALDTATGRFLTRAKATAMSPSDERWYTILVGSFGSTGGYYALDVSWPEPSSTGDPPTGYSKGPRFLWQLTTDSAGHPLFGDRSGTPTITTLFFSAATGEPAAEHAVAILPGGFSGKVSTTTAPSATPFTARPAMDSDYVPRDFVRNYDPRDNTDDATRALGGAKSITIVRLDNGEVIRSFRAGDPNQASEMLAPPGLYATSPVRITRAPFVAPIAGQLVAYPAGAGIVSDRAFVGDQEGYLYRMDLSDQNPANWKAELFFDAFPKSGPNITTHNCAATVGGCDLAQPIQTPPILSVDTIGRVTLAFSTGDQEQTALMTSVGVNAAWSLTENSENGSPFKSKANWFLNGDNAPNNPDANANHFTGGERVTGAMSIFDRKMYFVTYAPNTATTATCTAGAAYLWGADYINADSSRKPTPQLDFAGNGTIELNHSMGSGSIPFGVAVTQQPSCFDLGTGSADEFVGFGAHSSLTNVTPGSFQLVVQMGSTTSNTQPQTTTIKLAAPSTPAVIDSWASIVE